MLRLLTSRRDLQRGRRLGALLRGPEASCPEALGALEALTPWILRGGVAAWLWRRWSSALDPAAPGLAPLRRARAAQLALHARRRRWLPALAQHLDAAGVTYLLFKGPALARHYPAPHLRPYTDLDVLLEDPRARGEVERFSASSGVPVDVHTKGPTETIGVARAFAACTRTELEGASVPVLPPELELVHSCLHYVRHGCCRPIWHLDIVHLLQEVDVDEAIAGWTAPRQGAFVAAVVAAVREIAGGSEAAAPGWLVPETYAAWGAARMRGQGSTSTGLLTRADLLGLLASRWPPTIEALHELGRAVDDPRRRRSRVQLLLSRAPRVALQTYRAASTKRTKRRG